MRVHVHVHVPSKDHCTAHKCLQVPLFELCVNLLTVTFSSVVRYNEEKEKKAEQEKKQRQLEAIELARKLEEEEKKKNGAVLLHSLTYFNNAPS